MGVIGCLGEIPFEADSVAIGTIRNAIWAGAARYVVHQIHGQDACTEFLGREPDTFSFEMQLYTQYGSPPLPLLDKLWEYERNGTPVALTIGEKGYGKELWSVLSHTTQMVAHDRAGNLIGATVSVQLQEYTTKGASL